MFSEDPKVKAQRRKAKWTMAIVCGPVCGVVFAVLFYFLSIRLAGALALAATVFVVDRLSKRLKISAMDYSGPVAFSCVLFGLLGLLSVTALVSLLE